MLPGPAPARFDLLGRVALFSFSSEERPYREQIAEVYLDKHKSLKAVLDLQFTPEGTTKVEVLRHKPEFGEGSPTVEI